MNQGKLFVIEGTDSSGKESVSKAVYQKCIQNGYPALYITFPNYQSDTSTLVKMYLSGEFGSHAKDVNPYTASAFYAVDRIGSYLKEWKKAYEEGTIIIADRYTSSNAVHQASKIEDIEERKLFLKWLWDFEFEKLGLPYPTKTFFLNMPIQYSLSLMEQRMNKITGKQQKDIHEQDKEYMKKSYENACWVANYFGWTNIYTVTKKNTEEKTENEFIKKLRPIEEIAEEVYQMVMASI